MKLNSVAVIGLGLIGGSVCRAVKEFDSDIEVVGIDTDKRVIDYALKNKILDTGSTELREELNSDLVIIATYVDRIVETFEKVLPFLKDGCVVTDVGSVKSAVVEKIENMQNGGFYFLGSHPIAGSENPGIENSDEHLFRDKNVIVTPTGNTSEVALELVSSFWKSLGCNVIELDPEKHDEVFAYVSHLPHVIAYSLINAVSSSDVVDNIFLYSGGGLNDFTRIASSSPEMWNTIFIENKEKILDSINRFKESIEKTESAIKNSNLKELMMILENAKKIKNKN